MSETVAVPIPKDERGFLGRECPQESCQGYFKIKPGTGLAGKDLPCHCPYCGHSGPADTFWTRDQIAYAKSVVVRQVTELFTSELKKIEFNHRPRGGFGISVKVKPGTPPPIRYYQELELETEVACDNCTLLYTIYGVFGYCPDCGVHNSLQILLRNLAVVGKLAALGRDGDAELREHHLGNALQNAVAAFDGFGREVCRRNAARAASSAAAQKISFQNLTGARGNVRAQFGFDFAAGLPADDWTFAVRCFQKRHLFSHNAGVVDAAYVAATADPEAVVGRKVAVGAEEVERLAGILGVLGKALTEGMPRPVRTGAPEGDAA